MSDVVPAPDPVEPDEVPVVDEIPSDDPPALDDDMRPGFVDEIVEKLESILAAVSGKPDGDPDMPGDGDIVADENPVKPPWTHRKFLGR